MCLSRQFFRYSWFSSWQPGEHGASLHQGEARRGVSIYLTDAYPDPQRRGHQYSHPGSVAGSYGSCPVSQQSPGVTVWKVSGASDHGCNMDMFLLFAALKVMIFFFFLHSLRSWDLNKICYKSGVPIIENVMIERVSPQQKVFSLQSCVSPHRRLLMCLFHFLIADDWQAIPLYDNHPTWLFLGRGQTSGRLRLFTVSLRIYVSILSLHIKTFHRQSWLRLCCHCFHLSRAADIWRGL